jgi:hypothetical protein
VIVEVSGIVVATLGIVVATLGIVVTVRIQVEPALILIETGPLQAL